MLCDVMSNQMGNILKAVNQSNFTFKITNLKHATTTISICILIQLYKQLHLHTASVRPIKPHLESAQPIKFHAQSHSPMKFDLLTNQI